MHSTLTTLWSGPVIIPISRVSKQTYGRGLTVVTVSSLPGPSPWGSLTQWWSGPGPANHGLEACAVVVWGLYTTHLKMLLRKWRDPKYIFKRGAIPYSWTKRLRTDYGWNVNTSFSLNTGRIKTLPVEIAAGLYREWRADSKMEMHRAETSRNHPDKEQSRGTCAPDFKTYRSAAAIKTWQGMGSTKQIHGTSSGTGLRGVVRWFSVKVTNQRGKNGLCNKWGWNNWTPTCRKRNLDSAPITHKHWKSIMGLKVKPKTIKFLKEKNRRKKSRPWE